MTLTQAQLDIRTTGIGSKERWFNHYERLWNERADGELQGTDEELVEMAIDALLDGADLERKREKENDE